MSRARRRHTGRHTAGALSLAAVVAVVLIAVLSRGSGPTSGLRPGSGRSLGSGPRAGLRSPARTITAVLPAPVAAPGPQAVSHSQGVQFGANVNRVFENAAFTPAQVDAQLAALQATGATVARTDALWEFSEPDPPSGARHRYDWTFDDRVAGALAAHRLRWLPIIDYSAGWDKSLPGQLHSPPRSLGDYADYAGAFAARYGAGGAFWSAHPGLPALPIEALEVWNEPDNPTFWAPAPDPARYAELYQQTRDTVSATNRGVDVLIGGLFAPASFLPALLAAQPALVGHIDGISVHPYGADPDAIVARVVSDRHLLSRLGLGTVPLYVTEFGWTTSPPGARDYLLSRLRPGFLAATLAGLARAGCGLGAVVAYTWVTERQDPGRSQEWYGIDSPSGAAGPDAAAFGFGLRAAQVLSRSPGPCRVS
jgi:hypothetical protein